MGKIDLSKVTGALQKLSFLRSYSVLILPLVIAFASVVLFTAALLLGRSFQAKVEKQSIPIGRDVENRLKKPVPLGQVEVEKRYQQEYQKDADLIEEMTLESAQRELLGYRIFPEPNETSSMLFTRFGERFCETIDEWLGKLNAMDCPTEDEIKASVQRTTGAARTPSGMSGTDADRIIEEFCQARARKITVYAKPEDISGYVFWKYYQYKKLEEAVKDCWFWQLGNWIIEDVLGTVEKMNAGSSNVLSSPVKRIAYVGFTEPGKRAGGTGGSSKQVSQEHPRYVTKAAEMLAESCTGRISNEDIDVVHFSVVVVVSPESILPFMKELCSVREHRFRGYWGQEPERIYKHNQITVLQSKVKPVISTETEHGRYRYGPGPVMEMELVCEYIFTRKGYESIYPKVLKETEETMPEGQ